MKQPTVSLNPEPASIGTAIGRIPSGCSILTVEHNGQSTGVLVSWVQQASFEPPMLTVCLKSGRPAVELVDAAGKFLLNIIGEDPTPMFKHFGRGFAPGENAFAGLSVQSTPFGPLLTTCIAHLGCKVINRIRAGDHLVYVAQVESAAASESAKPYVHLRKNGLAY